MATIDGTAGDDVLNGTNKADSIYAGDGDDIINSGAGADYVEGGEGDDKINAGSGDDTLIGGAGDDVLNGGGGSDTFVFTFKVGSIPGELTTVSFRDGGIPNGSSNFNSVDNYLDQLGDWRDDLAASYGADQDTTLGGSVTYTGKNAAGAIDAADNYNSEEWAEVIGSTLHVDNEFTYGSAPVLAITQSDGNDIITSFQDAGPNVDKIVLNGLSELTLEQLDFLFDITTVDTDGDGTDDASLLTWTGGSIQIGGTVEWGNDINAFFTDDQVEWQ